MQLDCQLISDTGSSYGTTFEQREIAKRTKTQWQMLFQMGSDGNADMTWSDMGTICFYIREQDLKAHDFSDICLAFFTP